MLYLFLRVLPWTGAKNIGSVSYFGFEAERPPVGFHDLRREAVFARRDDDPLIDIFNTNTHTIKI